MRRMTLVQGRTPAEFAKKYNDTIERLSGFNIESEKFISDTAMYLFYEDGDDPEADDVVEEIRERAEAAFNQSMREFFIDAQKDDSADTETVEIRIQARIPIGRFCCECENYRWGSGCPYRSGRVEKMADACGMFDVVIERR